MYRYRGSNDYSLDLAYENLMKQYQVLSPSLNALEPTLFDMYDLGIAKAKHREFHVSSPFSKYAWGNWFSVSTLRLLIPTLCREAPISNPDSKKKYLEAFVHGLPEHIQEIKLNHVLTALALVEDVMKIFENSKR